jgi:hypothetical protein
MLFNSSNLYVCDYNFIWSWRTVLSFLEGSLEVIGDMDNPTVLFKEDSPKKKVLVQK